MLILHQKQKEETRLSAGEVRLDFGLSTFTKDSDFVSRRAREFIQSYFQNLLNPFKDQERYIVVRESRFYTVDAAEIHPGDLIFMREGQNVPGDIQLLPNFSSQQPQGVSSDETVANAVNYGVGKTQTVKTVFNETVWHQLLSNLSPLNITELRSKKIDYPQERISTAQLNKQIYYQKVDDFGTANREQKMLYQDYLFFGYQIQRVVNAIPLYYFDFDLKQLEEHFMAQHNLSQQQLQALQFADICYRCLRETYTVFETVTQDKASIGIKIAEGFYGICVQTKAGVDLYSQALRTSDKERRLSQDFSRIDVFKRRATIPSTFFAHLNELQKTIQKLPFTIFFSLLIIFIPHVIRLLFIPGYSTLLQNSFGSPLQTFTYGFIPSLCATISFGISSFVFINKASALFRPILKSAAKYVQILEERQISIPTLGALESLGFTNTLVADANLFLSRQSIMQTIVIGSKTPRGGARIFTKKDLKKFESVFAHRVLRPFYVLYSESETSTWLSFIRLVVGVSLQAEEASLVLRGARNARNIYCNDYIKPSLAMSQGAEDDSESNKAERKRLGALQRKKSTPQQKIQHINNRHVQQSLFSTLPLHEFNQSEKLLDFRTLIQPSCLQDAQVSVQQFHPLLTWPNLCFKGTIPSKEGVSIYVLRSSSAAQIIPLCKQIISHSIHESVQNIVSDATSDYNDEVVYNRMGEDKSDMGQFFTKILTQQDIQFVASQEKLMRQQCLDVVYYALYADQGNNNLPLDDILREKRFIFVGSCGFNRSVNSHVEEFIQRFQQNEQLGMNLVLSTSLQQQQAAQIYKLLGLQHYQAPTTQNAKDSQENSESDHPATLNSPGVHKNVKTPLLSSQLKEDSRKKPQCISVRPGRDVYNLLSRYILTKSLNNKQHLLMQKLKEQEARKKEKERQKQQKKRAKKLEENEEKQLLTSSNPDTDDMYLTLDDDNTSEDECGILAEECVRMDVSGGRVIQQQQKRHKKRARRIGRASDNGLAEAGLLTKPSEKKSGVNIFLATETSALQTASSLNEHGLFVSLIQQIQRNDTDLTLDELIDKNQSKDVQTSQNPDFLIVNYDQNADASKAPAEAANAILQQQTRVSLCGVGGKHGLCRLLDVCQEVPFYLMTLSPVFLGTVRSRLMIGLLPLYGLLCVSVIEAVYAISGGAESLVRPFFYPPVSCGAVLLFSLLYIEILLPLIIWTPPKSLFSPSKRKQPQYIGNRAAMLWDFNKLLPRKTSSKALLGLAIVFFFCCLVILLPSWEFYGDGTAQDDFLSSQELRLSPFISVYYCMFFTAFATGALLVANKLPLGKVWGQDVPLGIKVKKTVIFVLLQVLCLVVIFVVPTVSNQLGRVLLGFDTAWITDNFFYAIVISFMLAIAVSVFWILEQVLFVRV